MVIVMQSTATEKEVETIIAKLVSQGFDVHRSTGVERTVLGAGGAKVVDVRDYELMRGVKKVHRITQPYKLASRTWRPEGSIIKVRNVEIGGKEVVVMAGPCTIENYEQCDRIAERVKAAGAKVMRGGAFKPRTSPYAFRDTGLRLCGRSARRPTNTICWWCRKSWSRARFPLQRNTSILSRSGPGICRIMGYSETSAERARQYC